MPITPFLNGERFDLEGERVLRLALVLGGEEQRDRLEAPPASIPLAK